MYYVCNCRYSYAYAYAYAYNRPHEIYKYRIRFAHFVIGDTQVLSHQIGERIVEPRFIARDYKSEERRKNKNYTYVPTTYPRVCTHLWAVGWAVGTDLSAKTLVHSCFHSNMSTFSLSITVLNVPTIPCQIRDKSLRLKI